MLSLWRCDIVLVDLICLSLRLNFLICLGISEDILFKLFLPSENFGPFIFDLFEFSITPFLHHSKLLHVALLKIDGLLLFCRLVTLHVAFVYILLMAFWVVTIGVGVVVVRWERVLLMDINGLIRVIHVRHIVLI